MTSQGSFFIDPNIPFNLIKGNNYDNLRLLPSESVQTCVTSPPYWGLRNYGTNPQIWGGNSDCRHEWICDDYQAKKTDIKGYSGDEIQLRNLGSMNRDLLIESAFCLYCGAWRGELGLEPTPELYAEHLVLIFREVRRVLKTDGTLWLNLGDSYWGGKGKSGSQGLEHQQLRVDRGNTINKPHSMVGGQHKTRPQDKKHPEIKPKDLVGIPWMVAFALRRDGWYLRQDCIWHKPNPMPESVKDRCVKAHEYIFLLSKSKIYFFDDVAIQEPAKFDNRKSTRFKGSSKYAGKAIVPGNPPQGFHSRARERWRVNDKGEVIRSKRSVWTVPTAQSKSSHTAVFPTKLIEPCVLAGSRPGDVVLDIFNGTATTGEVALKNNRRYIGMELNPEHIETSDTRLKTVSEIINT